MTQLEPVPRRRSRTTNNPLSRWSLSTGQGRRVADLYRHYLKAMGEPADVIRQADALAAAELKVAAEDARARLLAGNGRINEIVRVENLALRAERRLGIKPGGARDVAPSLDEYLKDWRAQETADADNVA